MAERDIDLALANAVLYLHAFGHVVVAWLWLRQGEAATAGLRRAPDGPDAGFYRGKLQALRWFCRFELAKLPLWSERRGGAGRHQLRHARGLVLSGQIRCAAAASAHPL